MAGRLLLGIIYKEAFGGFYKGSSATSIRDEDGTDGTLGAHGLYTLKKLTIYKVTSYTQKISLMGMQC